jgi:hypothetical protein
LDIEATFKSYRVSPVAKSLLQLVLGTEGMNEGFPREPITSAEWKQGPNLYWYVLNNPTNAMDPSGLIKYKPATCNVIDREADNTCVYSCYCPYGYSLGFMSSIIKKCCDAPVPAPQCFKLESSDYLIITGVVIGVGVVIIATGGAGAGAVALAL